MDAAAPGPRHEHISRITRLLDTARLLPEIVDWPRLAQEANDRLRAIAATAEDAGDFTPAVTAMIAGRLLNTATTPAEDQLTPLLSAVERLATPVDAAALAEIAKLIGRM